MDLIGKRKINTSMDLKQVTDDTPEKTGRRIAFELVLILSLSVGCWSTFFSMFPDPVGRGLTLALVTGLPVILYICCRSRFLSRFLAFYVFAFTAVFFMIFYDKVWNGMLVMVNIIIEVLNDQMAAGLVPFDMTGDPDGWSSDVFMAMIPVMLLVSMAVVYSVFHKEPLAGFALTLIPVLTGFLLCVQPAVWLVVLLLLSWTVLFVLSAVDKPVSRKKNRPLYIQSSRRSGLPYLFAGIVMALLLGYVLIFSDSDYRPPESIDAARDRIVALEEHLRYDKFRGDEMDHLSRGDLTDTHPLAYTEAPVLSLKMDMPTSMYLRGFAGGAFHDGKWSEEEEGTYSGEYTGMTEWLAQQGFWPWMQQDRLYRMSKDYDYVKVQVENVNGSSRYIYLPYEAAMTGDTLASNVKYIRDYGAYAKGLTGQRNYTFRTFLIRKGLEDYNESGISDWLTELKQSSKWDDYAQSEAVYRRFVYDTYLFMDNDDMKAIEKTGSERRLGRTVSFVLSDIRKMFDDEYEYDTEYSGAPKGKDELSYFLEESHTGNDMHFATAAALMFRAAGIPARYAEGYYLSPEYVKLLTEMDTVRVDVPDSLSHSWVEIYIDEIGWFPVEVVPGFYDMQKQMTADTEENEKIQEDKTKNYEDEKPEDSDDDNKKTDEKKKLDPKIFIPAGVLLLIILYEIIGRRYAARRKKKLKEGRDTGAVYARYRYFEKIMKAAGHPVSSDPYDNAADIENAAGEAMAASGMGYMQMLRLVNAVRFGDAEMTAEEHEKMADCIFAAARHVYSSSGRMKRFFLKFIVFYV
ncbi:MAG: transglutaminase-like domain-containing protein [Anaerovoracaceae bacterium]